MKKIISVLLASLFCFSALVACQEESGSPSNVNSGNSGTTTSEQVNGVDYTSEKKYLVSLYIPDVSKITAVLPSSR